MKILTIGLNFFFLIFWICISNFVRIKCYLLFDHKFICIHNFKYLIDEKFMIKWYIFPTTILLIKKIKYIQKNYLLSFSQLFLSLSLLWKKMLSIAKRDKVSTIFPFLFWIEYTYDSLIYRSYFIPLPYCP